MRGLLTLLGRPYLWLILFLVVVYNILPQDVRYVFHVLLGVSIFAFLLMSSMMGEWPWE